MGFLDSIKYRLPIKTVSLASANNAIVHVRMLSAQQADEFFRIVNEKQADGYRLAATLVSMCVCDESGALLCQQDGVAQCLQMAPATLEELYAACASFNAMNAKAAEAAEKN